MQIRKTKLLTIVGGYNKEKNNIQHRERSTKSSYFFNLVFSNPILSKNLGGYIYAINLIHEQVFKK